MEFNNQNVTIEIVRSENENSLIFKELDNFKLNLNSASSDDIAALFNHIFKIMIDNHKILTFHLEDNHGDLFYEVAEDISTHLNSEIKQSEAELIEIAKMIPSHIEKSI